MGIVALFLVIGAASGIAVATLLSQSQISRLRAELSVIQNETAKMRSDKAASEDNYQRMKDAYDQLDSNYTQLSDDHDVIQASLEQLSSNYTEAKSRLSDLTAQLLKLDADYKALNDSYSAIDVPYDEIVSKYAKLVSEYQRLNSSYAQLRAVIDQNGQMSESMLQYYTSLSGNVSSLYELLYSYSDVQSSFQRVLNNDAITRIADTVKGVTGSSKDSWSSYQKIYDHIVSDIRYVDDIDMPYISDYWYTDQAGYDYITSFSLDTIRNYVQTPALTVEIGQGDCEDQAVLAYAMIQYYRNHVLGAFYRLYLAEISFSDGSDHMAVIMPVSGGKICVIDPAGNYLTTTSGTIDSKAALAELQEYSDYWSDDVGTITYMKLYSVDVSDGSYEIAAEGTMNQVAAYLQG
jgi:archaellum component FlaC